MQRDLTFERVLPYTPARVWHALTNPAALADWLMENDFQAVVVHTLTFRTKPNRMFDGVIAFEVLEADEPTRLSYTWRGGPLDTVVTWTLEEVDGGTRIRLEHTGFQGFSGIFVSLILGSGWRGMLRTDLPANIEATQTTTEGQPA